MDSTGTTTGSKLINGLDSVFTFKFDLSGLIDILKSSGILQFLIALIVDLM